MDVLAIDLGTSALKVTVFGGPHADGGVSMPLLALVSEPIPTRHTADGGAEQRAEDWWESLGRAVGAARRSAPRRLEIGLVAVTSQYFSTVAVDRSGRPLSPVVTWMDGRGAPLRPGLRDRSVRALSAERHGLPPLPNDAPAHIAWLLARDPSLRHGAVFVEPADALVARLTGRVTATVTTAISLLAVDHRRHGSGGAPVYDADLLAAGGLDEVWLPPLVPADQPAGTLTADAAEHLGVRVGIPVATGTIDSVTSAVGTAASGSDAISLVVGTTSVMVSHVAAQRADRAHGISSLPSPVGGQYFVMAENGAGGQALEAAWGLVGLTAASGAPDFAAAERLAGDVPAGANGALFFPWLVGSMAPAPDDRMRAGFAGIGVATTRADLVRAAYEGVAVNAAWLFGPMCAFAGVRPALVRFGGGGARSALLARVLAGALAVPVARLADPAATNGRGAALLALVQQGHLDWADVPALVPVAEVHEPVADEVAIYAERRAAFAEYHALTRPFFRARPAP